MNSISDSNFYRVLSTVLATVFSVSLRRSIQLQRLQLPLLKLSGNCSRFGSVDHTIESALLDSFSGSPPAGLGFWSSAMSLGDDTPDDPDGEGGIDVATLRVGLGGMCSLRSSLMGLLGLSSSGGG
uniref:Uncharacterized protein n=1 Tax=Arundo donax TaxID=35708 RepID=A0A0A9BVY9_ARUDO